VWRWNSHNRVTTSCRNAGTLGYVFAVLASVAAVLSISGLHGTVVIDPARPVCVVGQPCSAPDRHEPLVFSRAGRRVAQATTDSNGNYRLSLAPGDYSVTAPRRLGVGRGLAPRRVTVPRGRYGRVNFTVDIGIR
jgi:hypothetical protein